MNRYASRTLFLTTALCLVLGVTLVYCFGAVAGAAQVPTRHDMSHPEVMTGPLGSAGRAGTTQFQPLDNLPPNCYNHVWYPQTESDGRNFWTQSNGDLEAWVQYGWCPTYAGDPNGLNFSYGRTYVTSGCEYIQIGAEKTQIASGAFLEAPNQTVWYDQEVAYIWPTKTCASSAPNNYIWDFSEPQTGAPGYTYKAAMIALAPYEYLTVTAYSYDFQ